jgi:hypothetical protein
MRLSCVICVGNDNEICCSSKCVSSFFLCLHKITTGLCVTKQACNGLDGVKHVELFSDVRASQSNEKYNIGTHTPLTDDVIERFMREGCWERLEDFLKVENIPSTGQAALVK